MFKSFDTIFSENPQHCNMDTFSWRNIIDVLLFVFKEVYFWSKNYVDSVPRIKYLCYQGKYLHLRETDFTFPAVIITNDRA